MITIVKHSSQFAMDKRIPRDVKTGHFKLNINISSIVQTEIFTFKSIKRIISRMLRIINRITLFNRNECHACKLWIAFLHERGKRATPKNDVISRTYRRTD